MNRKFAFWLISATALAALLAGCSASNAGVNNPPAAQTSAPAAQAPATTAPTTSAAVVPTSTEAPLYATSAPAVTSQPATTTSATSAAAPNATDTEAGFEPPDCGKSNCDQPGPAITQNLQGNATNGAQVFAQNCAVCHGQNGKGGQANPGSDDGVVPALNPIDTMFNTNDPKEFALEIDLFIEHGSHTKGPFQMPDWGDSGKLTPQQIADVIAYVMSLNTH